MDSAVAEVIDRVVGGFQRVAAGVEHDFALTREGHEADQVGVGADEVGGESDFAEYQRHGRERHGAAVTHQVVLADQLDILPDHVYNITGTLL